MTLKPTAMNYVKSAQNVKPASDVFEFQANPAFENLVENFRFSTAEDIMFDFELSSDSVYLFGKGLTRKHNTKHPKPLVGILRIKKSYI